MKSFVAEIAGLALYILFVQYVLADFVFEKPNEAWIRIGWHWMAAQREAWWQANVAATYNQSRSVDEPTPESP